MSWIAVAIGGGAALGYLGQKDAADSADSNARLAAEVEREKLEMAREQWNTYKEKIMPLELEAQQLGVDARELALSRGEQDLQMFEDYYKPLSQRIVSESQEDLTDRYTQQAAGQISNQFDNAQAMRERQNFRLGLRPDSGRFQGREDQVGLQRAAAMAKGQNDARMMAEDTRYQRMIQAAGGTPMGSSPSQGSPGAGVSPANAGNLMASAGAGYQNMANMYANDAANAMSGGLQMGVNAAQLWQQFKPQTTTTPVSSPVMTNPGAGAWDQTFTPPPSPVGNYQNGGLVRRRYADGGEVSRSPEPQMPMDRPSGSFVERMAQVREARSRGLGLSRGAPRPQPQQQFAGGGMVAPNGMVMGPPGPDQVPALIDGVEPARIQSGEMVIPEDVVDAKGSEFFTKMIEKYHQGPPQAGLQSRRVH